MSESIHHSESIYNCLRKYGLCKCFTHTVIKHIMAILIAVFSRGYKGKTVQFAQSSPYHRTTVAHFLNHGKWDSDKLESVLQQAVIDLIYGESMRTGKPVLCLADDTISSKTKPSSQAGHPIEDAHWCQSHLKKKQDYGHQAVSVTLSCNGVSLNYAIELYDKSRSKIQILLDIAEKLPQTPVLSYFLCDSWYTSVKIMEAFLKKGFYTIGALKSNRVIFPAGIRQQIGQFAPFLRKTDSNVRLVTVGARKFYVYRYEGKLNEIENAVVLISYPKDAFGVPAALRAFISTDVSLSTMEILNLYVERWKIEVFFRQAKQKLALDKYQIRCAQGVRRFWLLMSLAHFICCTGTSRITSFEDGYSFFQNAMIKERVEFIYRCASERIPLVDVLSIVA